MKPRQDIFSAQESQKLQDLFKSPEWNKMHEIFKQIPSNEARYEKQCIDIITSANKLSEMLDRLVAFRDNIFEEAMKNANNDTEKGHLAAYNRFNPVSCYSEFLSALYGFYNKLYEAVSVFLDYEDHWVKQFRNNNSKTLTKIREAANFTSNRELQENIKAIESAKTVMELVVATRHANWERTGTNESNASVFMVNSVKSVYYFAGFVNYDANAGWYMRVLREQLLNKMAAGGFTLMDEPTSQSTLRRCPMNQSAVKKIT